MQSTAGNKEECPPFIKPPFEVNEANFPVFIYDSWFKLKNRKDEFTIGGRIDFNWFPNPEPFFTGKSKATTNLLNMSNLVNRFDLIIDSITFGKAFITDISFDFETGTVSGQVHNSAFLGDKSIPVNKIIFFIPNMRGYNGLRIKHENGNIYPNRIVFDDGEYIVTLDKRHNYDDLRSDLKRKGGYILQYIGEITKQKGSLIISDMEDFFLCFNTFVSFLNGRRTSAFFNHGYNDEELIWRDYTGYVVDPYVTVRSWSDYTNSAGFNQLWCTFKNLWKDESYKDFLILANHWYLEANKNSGYTEGAIIMAQTALELIYNWMVVERDRIIVGKDAQNITAANKMRLLLSKIKVPVAIPLGLKNLTAHVGKGSTDGPEIITEIRNDIVHSRADTRRKLNKISDTTKYEALQLCIWYIELAILNILEYKGDHYNRCAGDYITYNGIEKVPWG